MKAGAVAVLLAGLLLSGCVSTPWDVLNEQLTDLRGQPVKTAIDRLGHPTSEGQNAGENFYVWSTSNTVSMPDFSTTAGSGMVGSTPFTYDQGSMRGGDRVSLRCTLRIFYDNDHIITHTGVDGNSGGCAPYAHRLDPAYHSATHGTPSGRW
jgi:hypothetical protein